MNKLEEDFIRLQGKMDTLEDLAIDTLVGLKPGNLTTSQRQLATHLINKKLLEITKDGILKKSDFWPQVEKLAI